MCKTSVKLYHCILSHSYHDLLETLMQRNVHNHCDLRKQESNGDTDPGILFN